MHHQIQSSTGIEFTNSNQVDSKRDRTGKWMGRRTMKIADSCETWSYVRICPGHIECYYSNLSEILYDNMKNNSGDSQEENVEDRSTGFSKQIVCEDFT